MAMEPSTRRTSGVVEVAIMVDIGEGNLLFWLYAGTPRGFCFDKKPGSGIGLVSGYSAVFG